MFSSITCLATLAVAFLSSSVAANQVFAQYPISRLIPLTPIHLDTTILTARASSISGLALILTPTTPDPTSTLTTLFAAPQALGIPSFKLYLSIDQTTGPIPPSYITSLLQTFTPSPSYLTLSGKPVVAARGGNLTEWEEIKAATGCVLLDDFMTWDAVVVEERERGMGDLRRRQGTQGQGPENETLPVVNETLPIVNETLPVVNETLPIVNETLPVVNETAPVQETPSGVQGQAGGVFVFFDSLFGVASKRKREVKLGEGLVRRGDGWVEGWLRRLRG